MKQVQRKLKDVLKIDQRKSYLTREIDKGEYCWNFAWLEESVSVQVSLEQKTEEYSMCVGDCIDSDRDRFTMKGVL